MLRGCIDNYKAIEKLTLRRKTKLNNLSAVINSPGMHECMHGRDISKF